MEPRSREATARTTERAEKPRICEAKSPKSEISFAPASRKEKCTKSQEIIFAQGRPNSIKKVDRAQTPIVVAQGLRKDFAQG